MLRIFIAATNLLLYVGGTQYTTVLLTANGSVFTSGTNSGVKLSFSATNADATNSTANDYLDPTQTSYTTNANGNPYVGTTQFCSPDWVVRRAHHLSGGHIQSLQSATGSHRRRAVSTLHGSRMLRPGPRSHWV